LRRGVIFSHFIAGCATFLLVADRRAYRSSFGLQFSGFSWKPNQDLPPRNIETLKAGILHVPFPLIINLPLAL
jgi:hypothetical protein